MLFREQLLNGWLSRIWLQSVSLGNAETLIFQEIKKKKERSRCWLWLQDAFVSTASTIGYITEECTVGLIVKVSSFWLVYGWTIYIYNNILKKLREFTTLSFVSLWNFDEICSRGLQCIPCKLPVESKGKYKVIRSIIWFW